MSRPGLTRLAFLLAQLVAASAAAEGVTVAVASNFAATAGELAEDFESLTGHRVRLVRGSTGKLYAQIVNGLPVDVFLSADSARPRQLVDEQFAVTGSKFTYALGELVVWSRDPELEGRDCGRALRSTAKKVAIANPLLAPYGMAARAYLQHESIWRQVQPRLVYGENIAQTLQFVATGNAAIGLVAKSQLGIGGLPPATCMKLVPPDTHAPIEQAAVLLRRSGKNVAAREFLAFLAGENARAVIEAHGYRLPPSAEKKL